MRQHNSVMLIDDDQAFNFINREVIEFVTFSKRTKIYAKADEALSDLREMMTYNPAEFPEVIFLDIDMPEMDGWEFLDEFEKFPAMVKDNCKVFMLTSSINQTDIDKSKSYDVVHDFVSKPLTADKLFLLKHKTQRF